MNRVFTLVLTTVALVHQVTAGENVSPSTPTNVVELTSAYIARLAEELRTNHPALRAAEARTSAAEGNVKSIRTWDDPMFKVGAMAAADEMMRANDGDLLYGAEQKLPLFGKPQAERKMARAEAQVEQAMTEAKFQELRRDLAQAVFKTALANRIVEITEQDIVWLDTMLQSVQRRYQVGDATQFDVLRLQNEHSQRLDQLTSQRERLKHEHVNLNRMLNRDLQSPWPVLRLPQAAVPVAYSQRLVDLAVVNQPELKARRQAVQQAETSVTVARKERFPEVGVGAESRNYSGNGEWRQAMFTLSFSFPWGNTKSYNAAIQRERAKLRAAEFDASDYELSLRNEVHDLTVKIDTARREAVLYRDEIIPRSETAFRTAQSGWETASGMFRDVLDARRMWLDAQLMYARALSEQYVMLSDLVLCCGLGDLESLKMIGVEMKSQPADTNK